MCRLLGIYGKVDYWPEIVNAFRELAQTGRVPPVKDILPGHKDGWGMAKSNQDQTAMVPIAKQMGSAADSNLFSESVDTLSPTRILMCHLRKASSSVVVTLANVHPFYSGRWAFMHNGFISSAEKLPGDNSLSPTSEGSDSEYFFHHLLTLVSQRPSQQGEAETIYNACRNLPEDFTSLNNLMSDGRQLFCARWHATHENYYTLYTYRLADAVIICSEPLVSDSLQPENWEELPNRTVLRIHGSLPEIELYGPAPV